MYEPPSIAAQQVPVQADSEAEEEESEEASAQSDSDSEQFANVKGSNEQSEPKANQSPQSSTEDVNEYAVAPSHPIQDAVESAEPAEVERIETEADNQPLAQDYRSSNVVDQQQPISDEVEDSNSAPPSEPDGKQDQDVEMRDDNEDGYEGNNEATLIVGDDIRMTENTENTVVGKSPIEDDGGAGVASTKSEQNDVKLRSKLPSEDGSERKSGSDRDSERRDNRKRKRSR